MERAVYERMRELETAHWWFVGRRNVLTRLLSGLKLPKDAKILEAGCGVGGNIAMLAQFGQVSALEPDAPSREHVAQRTGVTPVEGFLPHQVPYADKSFDAVCAFDVVEHVEDDDGALAKLAALTKPGGYLVVTVPAYAWMWSRHDEIHHHKRRYTRGQILAKVRAAGIEPIKASYFNAALFPLAAVVRALKKLTGARAEDDAMPPGPLNAIFTWLFSLEAAWLAHASLPFGLSIVVIGRPAVRQAERASAQGVLQAAS